MLNGVKFLLITLVVLVLVAYWVISDEKVDYDNSNHWLIPELQDNINHINRIELSQAENQISMHQSDGSWYLNQADGFYANKENIVALLMNLRSVVLHEKKTTNPDNFTQLKLSESDAIKVALFAADKPVKTVLIGKSSTNSQGTFVRYVDSNQTWLASMVAPIVLRTDQWLLNRIVDIVVEDVERVELNNHENNETIIIKQKKSDDTVEFVMENIPENKQVIANANLKGLANGLANYVIEQAQRKNLTDLKDEIELIYDLYNGLSYQVKVYSKDDKYYATLKIKARDSTSSLKGGIEQSMEIFNQRYSGWMFLIPSYKFNAVNKNKADYLQDTTEDQEQ